METGIGAALCGAGIVLALAALGALAMAGVLWALTEAADRPRRLRPFEGRDQAPPCMRRDDWVA